MTWVRRHRGLVSIGVVVVVLATVVTWYINRDVPHALAYWVVDDRTIGVQATDGRGATCWVASTAESSADVRVDVECHPLIWFGAGTAEGYPYRFEVPLLTPLGDRPVLDGLGAEAVRCVAVRCGMPG